MAKATKLDKIKVTFGKRKKGKPKKHDGPKDKPTKPYRGQGR